MSKRPKQLPVQRVAQVIRNARLARGVTQDELADAMGVTRAAVAQWETARVFPRLGIVRLLCDVLGLGVASIIDAAAQE